MKKTAPSRPERTPFDSRNDDAVIREVNELSAAIHASDTSLWEIDDLTARRDRLLRSLNVGRP